MPEEPHSPPQPPVVERDVSQTAPQTQRLKLFSLKDDDVTPDPMANRSVPLASKSAGASSFSTGRSMFTTGGTSAFSFATGNPFFGKSTAVFCPTIVPSKPPPPLSLEIRHPRMGVFSVLEMPLTVEVPADATVADAADAVHARLSPEASIKGLTLLFAGTKLSCPSETLAALGIATGQSLFAMNVVSAITPPLGRSLAPPPPSVLPAAAAASAAATAAAPSVLPSAGSSSGTSCGETAVLRMRFVNGTTLDVPFDASMTGMGLKRLLESQGEGSAGAFRLFFGGREVLDALPLSAQKMAAGATLMVQRRDPKVAAASVGGGGGALGSKLILGGGSGMLTGNKRDGKFVGLRNQGATCYLNSLVQSLYMTPPFRASIDALGTSTRFALPPLSKSLVELFASLAHAPCAVSTEAFTSALRWGPVSRQQDVHEFWTLLCEKLEADLKASDDHAKMIEGLFEGQQRDYVKCHKCGTCSYRNDQFRDLKLQVPAADAKPRFVGTGTAGATLSGAPSPAPAADAAADADAADAASMPYTHPSGHADVLWSLRQLLLPEQMRGAEQYECDVCACKTDAERGVQLVELPKILTLQMKRFAFDFRTSARHKINTPFAFDTTVDLTRFVTPRPPAPTMSSGAPAGIEAPVTSPSGVDAGGEPALAPIAVEGGMSEVIMEPLTPPAPTRRAPAATAPSPSLPLYTLPFPTAAEAVDVDGDVYMGEGLGEGLGDPMGTGMGGTASYVCPPCAIPVPSPPPSAPGVGLTPPATTTPLPSAFAPPSAPPSAAVGDAAVADAATPAAAPNAVYDLYAVLVHAGSASFGHYYALIKDLASSEWHEFNDATVKPIKESELQRAWGQATSAGSSGWASSSSAYMLLYRQRPQPSAPTAAADAVDAAIATEGAKGGEHAPVAGVASTSASLGRLNFSFAPASEADKTGATPMARDADERPAALQLAAPQDAKRLRLTPPHDSFLSPTATPDATPMATASADEANALAEDNPADNPYAWGF